MGLLVRHVPAHSMARAQGYLAACSGIISSIAAILSGAVYVRYGERVYYGMAGMALSGAAAMWLRGIALGRVRTDPARCISPQRVSGGWTRLPS